MISGPEIYQKGRQILYPIQTIKGSLGVFIFSLPFSVFAPSQICKCSCDYILLVLQCLHPMLSLYSDVILLLANSYSNIIWIESISVVQKVLLVLIFGPKLGTGTGNWAKLNSISDSRVVISDVMRDTCPLSVLSQLCYKIITRYTLKCQIIIILAAKKILLYLLFIVEQLQMVKNVATNL